MVKSRKLLSALEVRDMQTSLSSRLDTVGLPSQPEVALKLLELSRSSNAQIADYSKIIKNDQAIAGRVMRLANSAFFAQRKPVSAIDRACVVLGIDRLKAVSLGFHLSRAAQVPTDRDYSRQIWGESLYRACLAAEMARLTAPAVISEAFVVGLMMDAGLPLMPVLIGDKFRAIRDARPSPGRLARVEFDELPFTHIDVISVMARKWRFPDLLVKPLEWHHTRPPDNKRDDALSRLHRIAYVVGLVELTPLNTAGRIAAPTVETPGVATAQRVLAVSDGDMSRAVKQSFSEYGMTIDMFSEVAQGLTNIDALMDAVQVGLTNAMDSVLGQDLDAVDQNKGLRLTIAGQAVELVKDTDAAGLAYLYDSKGSRLLSHRFEIASANAADISHALGLDDVPAEEIGALKDGLSRLAA
ncbi:MAG TPA: HDOD domain-containing protein [Phycisphaerales bacterium]|nr:HDOD domain-containing protein [Phycisphaerales bacterium]